MKTQTPGSLVNVLSKLTLTNADRMRSLFNVGLAAGVASVAMGLVNPSLARADDYVMISAISGCSYIGTKEHPPEPGHVAIGFFSDDDGRGKNMRAEGTAAVWKKVPPVTLNGQFDKDFIYRSADYAKCGAIASRWARVSRSRRLWLQNQIATETGTGCRVYSEIAGTVVNIARKLAGKGDGACSCVNFGTIVWRHVTADRERWIFSPTPTKIYNEIYRANGNRTVGWLDGGRKWD
jgi:hypothetical protein